MRILVNDYSGHPFQVQLSRQLARSGHEVLHTSSAFFQTPKGNLTKGSEDPNTFDIKDIRLSKPFVKFSYLKRIKQEKEYSHLLVKEIDSFQPDVIISSNTPLDAQAIILKHCVAGNIKFVFWLQDIYGIAIKKIMSKKLWLLGSLIGTYYMAVERRLLRKSDAIVIITEDFRSVLRTWGMPNERIHTIPNWAPLNELPMMPKDNGWSRRQGLADKLVLLYSGTLGMKHNPELLVSLAEQVQNKPDLRVVVISEGIGADYLQDMKSKKGLDNLILMGFQPFNRMPEILAAADINVAILEEDAGIFSVPSKVLSYLCSGRPLLLSVPLENIAARIVTEQRAGYVVAPGDLQGFLKAAERLMEDEALRQELGRNARSYAERTFNVDKIAATFEKIICSIGEMSP